MKKFEVTITETLKKKVEVEAETQEEAEQIVTDDWYKGEHILDADNFSEVVFDAKEYEPEKIKIVLLEPGKVARVTEIDASLKGMQKIVGGNIDVVSLDDLGQGRAASDQELCQIGPLSRAGVLPYWRRARIQPSRCLKSMTR